MASLRSRVWRFDAFTLDLVRCALLQGNQTLTLRRRSFDVLRYLAERPGEVISKQELREAVWMGVQVGDDSVVQCVKEIRQALGEDARWIIRTESGRGYTFMADVVSADPDPSDTAQASPDPGPRQRVPGAAAPRGARWKTALIAIGLAMSALAGVGSLVWQQSEPPRVLTMMAAPSIAVLAFATPGDLDQSNSAGSLADEIAAGLMAAPRGFRIWLTAGHSESQRTVDARAAGRALNVRYLVLGSLRREGGGLRANVQLVEAESGRQLWAEPFDYAPDQPGAQNRTAARIARLVTNELLAAESQRPLPAEALADHYAILGWARLLGGRGIKANEEAIALFEKGLALDPQSAPALQGLARTKVNAVLNGWVSRQQRSQWLDQVDAAIERVIAQEPRSPEAYRLRGSLYRARGDNDQAIKALERAVDLYANFAAAHAELGRVKIEVGRASETVAHVATAVKLSPTDPSLYIWCFWAGQGALHAGDDSVALDWLLRARQANRDYANPQAWLAVAYFALGREDEARAAWSEFLIEEPGFTVDGWNRAHPRRNPELTVQRNRIESLFRRLGAPENRQQASSAN